MRQLSIVSVVALIALASMARAQSASESQGAAAPPPVPQAVPVTVDTFTRAETDTTFESYARQGAFGKFQHARELASIDDQKIVRMNRDTLYSFGVFDLDAAPVTIDMPKVGKRYMMAQTLDEDQYTHGIAYAPATIRLTRKSIGTRYATVIVRTLVNPDDPEDLKAVHALQDAIKVTQKDPGVFTVPQWDSTSQEKVRNALKQLGSTLSSSAGMFGSRKEVDPVHHLIGTAIGWGGNPRSAAIYISERPRDESGTKVERLTVKNVPVDGFWSISVYNKDGYFQKNDLNAYSINNLTARPNPDGSITAQFGGCTKEVANCLPITPGWNYTVRLYRPRAAVLDGSWLFPLPELVSTP